MKTRGVIDFILQIYWFFSFTSYETLLSPSVGGKTFFNSANYKRTFHEIVIHIYDVCISLLKDWHVSGLLSGVVNVTEIRFILSYNYNNTAGVFSLKPQTQIILHQVPDYLPPKSWENYLQRSVVWLCWYARTWKSWLSLEI